MPSKKSKPQSVSKYIQSAPKESQKKLREMRTLVRKAAPKADEGLRWKLPAISAGRILVMYGGFKKHIGFYPTASVLKAFKKELSKFNSRKGSVQFPLDKPLPAALIKKMVLLRIKECKKEDVKWRS